MEAENNKKRKEPLDDELPAGREPEGGTPADDPEVAVKKPRLEDDVVPATPSQVLWL
jgi:hypothetical protein